MADILEALAYRRGRGAWRSSAYRPSRAEYAPLFVECGACSRSIVYRRWATRAKLGWKATAAELAAAHLMRVALALGELLTRRRGERRIRGDVDRGGRWNIARSGDVR
jgi:hypothetical protein